MGNLDKVVDVEEGDHLNSGVRTQKEQVDYQNGTDDVDVLVAGHGLHTAPFRTSETAIILNTLFSFLFTHLLPVEQFDPCPLIGRCRDRL